MADNPHFLEKEIHINFDSGFLSTGFDSRISGLANDYPTGDAGNIFLYDRAIRELNRKLDSFGLNSYIKGETDAGFTPSDISGFFS